MIQNIDILYWPTFYTIVFCWFIFALIFLFRKRPSKSSKKVNNTTSIIGILLIAIGMALVWFNRRPIESCFIPSMPVLSIILDIFSIFIVFFSVGIVILAVQTLGKQWNVGLILVEGHTLITSGPYRIVRHPTYLGMIGLIVSTGIASSTWEYLLISILFAILGIILTIKAEEKFLKSRFGQEYESYQRKVSAFIPGIY